jgi:predicted nuclease of predicted toxin-antitoxin system
MRVLLDECLPRRLKRVIPGHQVVTVPDAGWAGRGNGELLSLAVGEFDVFVTVDQNLPAQQNLSRLQIGVIILQAASSRFQDLEPLVPELVQALATIKAGELVRLGG